MKYRYTLRVYPFFGNDKEYKGLVEGDTEMACRNHIIKAHREQIGHDIIMLSLYEIV